MLVPVSTTSARSRTLPIALVLLWATAPSLQAGCGAEGGGGDRGAPTAGNAAPQPDAGGASGTAAVTSGGTGAADSGDHDAGGVSGPGDAAAPQDASTCDGPCPSCDDGIKNRDESAVDCGGKRCDHCPKGDACGEHADCADGVCKSGKCAAPTCKDDVQNGSERGVDCGTDGCPPCAGHEPCESDDQCKSNRCLAGQCVPTQCMDGKTNGEETDRDCGGPYCLPCKTNGKCALDRDCMTGNCGAQGSCSAMEKDDNGRN